MNHRAQLNSITVVCKHLSSVVGLVDGLRPGTWATVLEGNAWGTGVVVDGRLPISEISALRLPSCVRVDAKRGMVGCADHWVTMVGRDDLNGPWM